MSKAKKAATAPRRPEKKYGPFAGGCGVVVWLNEVETDVGKRFFRSVQLAPRRYRSKQTGNWEDATSLRITDLPAIILALQAAHDYASSAPLPGQPAEEEHVEEAAAVDGNGTPPF
jgi:hypothetical protein